MIFGNITNTNVKIQITFPGKYENNSIKFGDAKIEELVVKDENDLPLMIMDKEQLDKCEITGNINISMKKG